LEAEYIPVPLLGVPAQFQINQISLHFIILLGLYKSILNLKIRESSVSMVISTFASAGVANITQRKAVASIKQITSILAQLPLPNRVELRISKLHLTALAGSALNEPGDDSGTLESLFAVF